MNKAANSFINLILILNILWASYTYSNSEFFCTVSTQCLTASPRFAWNRLFAIGKFTELIEASLSGNYTAEELQKMLSNSLALVVFNILLFSVVLSMILVKTCERCFGCFFTIFFCRCCKKTVIEEESGEDVEYSRK